MIRRTAIPALAALLVAGCGGSTGSADRLPAVEIASLDDGRTTDLSSITGPAVINLWATWCAPCRREIPDFEAVHLARSDEVRFVGVNIGEDAADAAAFIAEVGATYDQFVDSDGYVVTELGTSTMPVTLVVDADGVIVTEHLGPMDQDALNAAIDDALAVAP